MRESKFQRDFCKRLTELFPGCMIIKNDPQYQQGIPDRLFLYGSFWGMLEFKAYEGADERPNQAYYIAKYNEMSFAAFVYPENAEEVIDGIQSEINARRKTRIS